VSEFPTPAGSPSGDQPPDIRLYVPESKVWTARVKSNWEKEYCYAKFPGQDYLHLLLSGEIFLESKDERLCLTCALRRGVVTVDRLFWQNRPRITSIPVTGL
jgi:hypothetical protein